MTSYEQFLQSAQNNVAGIPPELQAAWDLQAQRGLSGSPITGAANQQTLNSLSGQNLYSDPSMGLLGGLYGQAGSSSNPAMSGYANAASQGFQNPELLGATGLASALGSGSMQNPTTSMYNSTMNAGFNNPAFNMAGNVYNAAGSNPALQQFSALQGQGYNNPTFGLASGVASGGAANPMIGSLANVNTSNPLTGALANFDASNPMAGALAGVNTANPLTGALANFNASNPYASQLAGSAGLGLNNPAMNMYSPIASGEASNPTSRTL